MAEEQKFIDETRDREYFTITPNIIINGYSATESGVYTYIKRRAGERGNFYERVGVSAKNLQISAPTFRKIRHKFIIDGRLQYAGDRKENVGYYGGRQTTKVFKIVDIWKENVIKYKDRKKTTTPNEKGRKMTTIKDRKTTTTKKNTFEEKPISVRVNPIYTLPVKRKDLNIIKMFASYKKFPWDEVDRRTAFIKRHLRAARDLLSYQMPLIEKIMIYLDENADFKWTLSSVSKYIDEDLAELKTRDRKGNGEWKCDLCGRWHPKKDRECGCSILKEWKEPV